MGQSGRAAIKAIVFMGVGVFLLLGFISLGLQKTLKPNESERVRIREKYSPFDSARAMKDAQAIAGFGTRPSGSPASAGARSYLKGELTKAGLRTWEQPYQAASGGAREGVNLVAASEGTSQDTILLVGHYGTVDLDGVAGANASASAAAFVLEWARALGPRREGPSWWMVWLDTEPGDSASAAAFADHLKKSGQLAQVRVMVGVEGVGDCFLQLQQDAEAPAWLLGTFWDTAERLRYTRHFGVAKQELPGAEDVFRNAGIASIFLRDGVYGGSVLEHQKLWNTMLDTMDRVCPESLQAVADVLYHALPAIEGRLQTPGMALQ